MPISGLIAGRMSEAFQDLLAQRFAEEERREQQRQREFENSLRLQQMEEAKAEREATRAYRGRQEQRETKQAEEEALAKTISVLQATRDPRTGAPIVATEELYRRAQGTPYAPLLEPREIFPEATVGEMGPEPGTPSTQYELRKTAADLAAEETQRKQREQEARLGALAGRTDLPPETQAFVGLGPEFAGKLRPEDLIPTTELERREKAESQRRIQEALATRAPREPEQPDVYLERKLPSGEVQSTLETNANARRLLQSGQGWAIPGKGTAAGGGRVPAQLMRSVEALGNINTALDRMREISATINTEEGLQARTQGWMARGKQMAGYAPEIVRLDAATKGRLSQFARALGEVGVLSNQDIQRVETLMPAVTDTRSEADAKMNELEFIFDSATDRVREMAESQGVQLPPFMKSKQPTGEMGPPAPAAAPGPAQPGELKVDLRYNPQTKRYERVVP